MTLVLEPAAHIQEAHATSTLLASMAHRDCTSQVQRASTVTHPLEQERSEVKLLFRQCSKLQSPSL